MRLQLRRLPAVAAVRRGTVVLDYYVRGLTLNGEDEEDGPLNAGDVLVSVPSGVRVPMEIRATIGIRRPHLGIWTALMRELHDLEA